MTDPVSAGPIPSGKQQRAPSTPWTPAQDDLVRALFRQQVPVAEIAPQVGHLPRAVGKRARKLGLRMFDFCVQCGKELPKRATRAQTCDATCLEALYAVRKAAVEAAALQSLNNHMCVECGGPNPRRHSECCSRICQQHRWYHTTDRFKAASIQRARTPEPVLAPEETVGNQPDVAVVAAGAGPIKTTIPVGSDRTRRPPWSPEEMEILREDIPDQQVAERTGRTRAAAHQQRHLNHIKVTPWTGWGRPRYAWDQQAIALLHGPLSNKEIAKQLGVSHQSVQIKRHQLGLRPAARWGATQDAILLANTNLSPQQLADLLEHPVRDIYTHLRRFGLGVGAKHKGPFTAQENAAIRAATRGHAMEDLAAQLERSIRAVRDQQRKLELIDALSLTPSDPEPST